MTMKGLTLSHETAKRALDARQNGVPMRLLDSDFVEVGTGPWWDKANADRAADALRRIKEKTEERGEKLDVNTFDKAVCAVLHGELELPPNLVAADGFWRWLAVEKFGDLVEARAPKSRDSGFVLPRNYGINASVTDNRIAIMWFRADMVYDPEAEDSYHLATRPAHTDFWESGIIRHRYAWSRNLARSLVRFQYRDPESDQAFLHSTHVEGIRELYKRLRRLHTTISFEYLGDDEINAILEQKCADLKRA